MTETIPLGGGRDRRRPLDLVASPITWSIVALAIVAAAQVADRLRNEEPLSAQTRAFYLSGQTAYAPAGESADEVHHWSFDRGLPSSWTPVGRVLVPRAGATVKVRTGTQPSAYQLISPVVTLEPGAYQAVVQGTVDRGGLSVGVLDPVRETFVAVGNFWSGQNRATGTVPAVVFQVATRMRVRVVLSNWTPEPATSNWTIGRVGIRPFEGLPVPLARVIPKQYVPFYTANASELLSKPRGEMLVDWSFALQVPPGWRPVGLPRLGSYRGALRVTTTQTAHGYQLVGPPVELGPGRYAALVEGTVVRGGMLFGVLGVDDEQWVETGLFWEGQTAGPDAPIGASFSLERRRSVRIVLANWAPEPNPSSWAVRNVRIFRAD